MISSSVKGSAKGEGLSSKLVYRKYLDSVAASLRAEGLTVWAAWPSKLSN